MVPSVLLAMERIILFRHMKTPVQGFLHKPFDNKGSFCADLVKGKGLNRDQVCCVGDDLPDIPMFNHSGLPIAVADAAEEVRAAAFHVTGNRGGRGAVREVCELILKAKGLWSRIISDFTLEGK